MPDGILNSNQIRGVDKDYRYQYREFPKALTPAEVAVTDARHEARLRSAWHMALPWDGQGPIETKQRDDYYAAQVYPKVMQPPQVIVENADEEVKILASWNVKASAMAKAEKWPHYM